jgi:hypothetical protein
MKIKLYISLKFSTNLKTSSKKLVLDNAALEEEFFEDVVLTGIVCPLESYKLVWLLNQYLNFNFTRNHFCEVKVNETFFPVFSYSEEEKQIDHFIYCNRNKTKFMLNEIKNIDFIWLIKGIQFQPGYLKNLQLFLKKIPQVVYTFDINPNTLTHRQHLIL